MNTLKYLVLTLSFAASGALAAHDIVPVQAFRGSDNVPGPDATSRLGRMKSSIVVDLTTSGLDPNSPYTLWAVVFNRPQHCQTTPCGTGDLPISPGYDPRVDATIVFAGGGVSDADGRVSIGGRVRKAHGRVSSEPVLGSGSLNSRTAEIHIVVRGHGYPPSDLIFESLSTFAGGCSEDNPCEDQQFAVHLPQDSGWGHGSDEGDDDE